MAPPRAPRSKRGLANRLTAKAGPLPVWAWAAVILGAYFLYSRLGSQSKAVTSPDAAAASSSDRTTGDAQVPASGQGSPADNQSGATLDALGANTSAIDALTSQILSMPTPYTNFGDAPPAGDMGLGTGPASQPTTGGEGGTRPDGTTIIGADRDPVSVGVSPGRGGTQTRAGVLNWGGVAFTTRAQFDSWARSHGTTSTRELSQHPTARAIYSTLK